MRRGAGARVVTFADRRDAGQRLAAILGDLADRPTVVLGIPRGGVEVAAVVAGALGAPLDVVVPRKIGAPGNPELGIGAVAEGVQVLDERLIRLLGVDAAFLESEIAEQRREIARRVARYRGDRPPPSIAGRTAVVVDDGVATGGTAVAALRWAAAQGAGIVVLAVPVAPPEAIDRLHAEAHEVRALETPRSFSSVGQWYEDFPQVPDERVVALLEAAR
jgi:putative phosphoribosyl transferase